MELARNEYDGKVISHWLFIISNGLIPREGDDTNLLYVSYIYVAAMFLSWELTLSVDLSISQAGPGSGRVEKNWVFQAEKILPMPAPWDVSGLSFRAGPGLGRVAYAFYSVK
jgi:hypothetical protein